MSEKTIFSNFKKKEFLDISLYISDDDTLSSVLISPPLTPDIASVRSQERTDSSFQDSYYSPKPRKDRTHKRSASADSKQQELGPLGGEKKSTETKSKASGVYTQKLL